ncbi:MAG: BON domain-containing protein [Dehalococcoidia bacterium]|nr:BON domain-containing protein [Dehalococcoidia bacterium]
MPDAADIERRIAEEAGLDVIVEEDRGRFIVSGIVGTDSERDRAMELARTAAGLVDLEDGLEVAGRFPGTIGDIESLTGEDIEPTAGDDGFEEVSLEAMDFAGDEHTTQSAWVASGPTSAIDDDIVSEGDTVFSPPTDPVAARHPVTLQTVIIGGLQSSSMEDISVARSALDGEYGDEAIADAIRRELLEDAATTDLAIDVEVFEGVATLRGRVALLEDAENAEEVAARVPGVLEVREHLHVDQMDAKPRYQ